MQDATMPGYCEQSEGKIISTEVLIIGFGFSAIPLIRELESAGTNYLIVSNGEGSIWDKLEKHGRLDFDLVSSMHTSSHSFELVKHDTQGSISDSQGVSCLHTKISDAIQFQAGKGLGHPG